MKIGMLSAILALSISAIVNGGEYFANFKNGSSNGWIPYDGVWSVASQSYKIAANSYGGKSIVSGNQFTNLVYEADIVMSTGNWDTGLIFRAKTFGIGDANYYGYAAALDQSGKVILIRGPGYNVIAQTAMTVSPNKSYRMQVWAIGSRIRIFVDGALKIDLNDATYSSGSIGLMSYSSAASFDNLLVTTETQNAKRDDFNDGNDIGWVKYDGSTSFFISNGKYVSNLNYGPKAILVNTDATDFIYQADVSLQADGDAGLIFRVFNPKAGPENYSGYYFGISTFSGAFISTGPEFNTIALASGIYSIGQTYHLKVVTLGPRLQGYVDGALVVDVTDNTYQLGQAGVSVYGSASFDNIAISQNVAGGLAKRAASNEGTFGTPPDWSVSTYWNPSYPDMKSEAVALQNAFRDAAFGWAYNFTEVGGPLFTYSKFILGTVRKNSDMVYIATHGNDGFFLDYDGKPIYLRAGYGDKSVAFGDKNKFICISGCSCLYYGPTHSTDLNRYLPIMKGVHAVLGYASSMQYPASNASVITSNIAKYFVSKWLGGITVQNNTGVFTAWRDAIFKATYYDNNHKIGNAPAVIFTAGDIKGQNNMVGHYWGWEEKTWNIYNGATYLTDVDKGAYGGKGETLVYNPNWGYPSKIGTKYATIGTPNWSGIVVLP